MDDDQGWSRWEKFVVAELKRLGSCYESVNKTVQGIHVEIARFDERAKAQGRLSGAIWGSISGIAVAFVAEWINKGLIK